jgi:MFS family permease
MRTASKGGIAAAGDYTQALTGSHGQHVSDRAMTVREPRGARLPLFGLPRPVWLLGWVSLLTDTASEMVYPLLPIFLTQVLGASAMSLGVIEGVADAASSALKIWSGWMADRTGTPKRFVLVGYALASGIRPLIALASSWPQVMAVRFADRLGKGLRTSPRDAMLASFAQEDTRGRVFGFHRAMDHTGAIIGPLIAAAFLHFLPGSYRTLFGLTLIPGIVVVLVMRRVPERPGATGDELQVSVAAPPGAFARAMLVVFLFTLGNASDAFLLLRLNQVGVPVVWIPVLWAALHVVKASSSLFGGRLSDCFGRRRLIASGWVVYALVYAGFGFFESRSIVVSVFLAYGLYFGLTEGVEKAWVTDLTPEPTRGTAFGIYNGILGVGALAASLLFGWLWTRVSPGAAFFTGASLAMIAAMLLPIVPGAPRERR